MIERRFSLEDDFMNFKTDDLLFGFMRCLSTAKPTGEYKDGKAIYQEYLTIKEFKKNKKLLKGLSFSNQNDWDTIFSKIETKINS